MGNGFVLRIAYCKKDRLVHLSHLETVRGLERIIRRAGLPYATTEGFNRHMKVSFGPALPVGIGGECEYIDLKLANAISANEALLRLQRSAPKELYPIMCKYVNPDDGAIESAMPISNWEAIIEGASLEEANQAFNELLKQGYIEIKKKAGSTKQVFFEGILIDVPKLIEIEKTSNHINDHSNKLLVKATFSTRVSKETNLRADYFIESVINILNKNNNKRSTCIKLSRISLCAEQ